jgi:hypothetical protein
MWGAGWLGEGTCEFLLPATHHTTPHHNPYQAIIAGAGGAAHLPGMVAAMTPLPVIGVPVKPAGVLWSACATLHIYVYTPAGTSPVFGGGRSLLCCAVPCRAVCCPQPPYSYTQVPTWTAWTHC